MNGVWGLFNSALQLGFTQITLFYMQLQNNNFFKFVMSGNNRGEICETQVETQRCSTALKGETDNLKVRFRINALKTETQNQPPKP